jgi:hypothetical protein
VPPLITFLAVEVLGRITDCVNSSVTFTTTLFPGIKKGRWLNNRYVGFGTWVGTGPSNVAIGTLAIAAVITTEQVLVGVAIGVDLIGIGRIEVRTRHPIVQ